MSKSLKPDEIVYKSPVMISIMKKIEKIAATPATVLITGESGTGKELAARNVHRISGVKGSFMPINLGGVPENLVESELFGFEKGAFTGAHTVKKGLLEAAAEGTLFLDEIGDISSSLQVKMLRVLQEKKIRRLGGLCDIPINARIIAATNRDLEALVKAGDFREDLYFRLNVARLRLPPLRERIEDLPLLTDHLINKLNVKFDRKILHTSEDVYRILNNYSFPGNIRELENILERGFIYSEGEIMDSIEIDPQEERVILFPSKGTLKSMEIAAILNSLQKWNGNRTKAAEELGITRRTIFNKIREYDLESFLSVT